MMLFRNESAASSKTEHSLSGFAVKKVVFKFSNKSQTQNLTAGRCKKSSQADKFQGTDIVVPVTQQHQAIFNALEWTLEWRLHLTVQNRWDQAWVDFGQAADSSCYEN